MASKSFTVVSPDHAQVVIEADRYRSIDGELKFYANRGGGDEEIAVFAKGQWQHVKEGKPGPGLPPPSLG